MRAFVVLGFVFPYQAKRFAWGTSPKWPVLCRVERKTLTQSTPQPDESMMSWDSLHAGDGDDAMTCVLCEQALAAAVVRAPRSWRRTWPTLTCSVSRSLATTRWMNGAKTSGGYDSLQLLIVVCLAAWHSSSHCAEELNWKIQRKINTQRYSRVWSFCLTSGLEKDQACS